MFASLIILFLIYTSTNKYKNSKMESKMRENMERETEMATGHRTKKKSIQFYT